MCGIGTTLVEAIHLGRDALGIEYEAALGRPRRTPTCALAEQHGGNRDGRSSRGDARRLHRPDRRTLPRQGRLGGHLTAVRASRARTGPLQPARPVNAGGQEGLPLRPRPGQPRPRLHHRPPGRLHRDPRPVPTPAAPRRHRRRHHPPLARTRRTHRPALRRPRRRPGRRPHSQPNGASPSSPASATAASIARPSFFQMKNVRDARRQAFPSAVVQHEDVLVFTRPGQQTTTRNATTGKPQCTAQTAYGPTTTATVRSRTCARKGRSGSH